MLSRLDLIHFKCFEMLALPLGPLTLLSGANSTGKSSVFQGLVLLHQTMKDHEWSSRLMLNGKSIELGTVGDVIDKVHGRFTMSVRVASPVPVTWFQEIDAARAIEIQNHWEIGGLEKEFQNAAPPIVSWAGLEIHARATYVNLRFLKDTFVPLRGQPFVQVAVHRIMVLLNTLNTLKASFTDAGGWSDIGNKIYREHFNSRKAWFGDSSDGDVAKWGKDMTFPRPEIDNEFLFCPWHGKVKTPQIRIHFSHPIQRDTPLCIAYVGPKIAKW